jgi:hypothetical protein
MSYTHALQRALDRNATAFVDGEGRGVEVRTDEEKMMDSAPDSILRIEKGVAVCCAWCKDKQAGDDWAEIWELPVTHTICKRCRREMGI